MSTSKYEGIELKRGLELGDADLIDLALGLSSKKGDIKERILHWEFGPIMNMRLDHKATNYLFSAEAVPLHWDGAFYREPKKLLFYCVDSAGVGGETLFSNTSLLWNSLSENEKTVCRQIRLRYSTEKKAHYGGTIEVPLVQQHPETGRTILRLAERVETQLNPVTLEIIGTGDAESFYRMMIDRLYHEDFLVTHCWEKGDLLVCDNFTFLHGRNPLRENLLRSFKRVQIL